MHVDCVARVHCGSHDFLTIGDSRALQDSAARIFFESETQPKMPPCALIMRKPISWNSGKYEAQQSPGTMHRKPRSFASRTVVCTHTSVVTPHTIKLSMPLCNRIEYRSV